MPNSLNHPRHYRTESKGSCDEVEKAVRGLRETQGRHHVEAFGIIDRDDRSEENVADLAERGVFALDVYSVEGLYYCSEVIRAVADWQEKSYPGVEACELIKAVKDNVFNVLKKPEIAEQMAMRRCRRRMRDRDLWSVADWNPSLGNTASQQKCIAIDTKYDEELNRYNNAVENEDLDGLVAQYPLHKSKVLQVIAQSLNCQNRRDYENMVIARVRYDDELKLCLKKRLGLLSEKLDSV